MTGMNRCLRLQQPLRYKESVKISPSLTLKIKVKENSKNIKINLNTFFYNILVYTFGGYYLNMKRNESINKIHSTTQRYATFYFLDYTKYRESIAFAQKTDFQILMNLHVLRATESKKSYFWHVVCVSVCLSVCVCVCLSVDTITQKLIELAQPNSVCDFI